MEGRFGQPGEVHQRLGDGRAFGKSEKEAPPEFAAGLQHPGFEIEVVGGGDNAVIGSVVQ